MQIREYTRLISSLEILCSSKENQIIYLKELQTYPSTDELALEFDDAYRVYKGMVLEGQIDTSNGGQLEKINFLFEAMSESSDQNIWTVDELDNTLWSEIRNLACDFLIKIKGV